MRDLDVYLHTELVAQVTFNAGGTPAMHYVSNDALALSLSLPNDGTKLKHSTVQRYFDNLLPDNDATRKQWADRFAAEHGTRVNRSARSRCSNTWATTQRVPCRCYPRARFPTPTSRWIVCLIQR